MSDHKRRKLLKSIATGGGVALAGKALPEKWTKPMVNAVVLPAHALTSEIITTTTTTTTCLPCLVDATYCVGSGARSMQVHVSTDGIVTVTHNNGTRSDAVDPCLGGDFSVTITSTGGGTIIISGTIPCGAVSSIEIIETDANGQNPRQHTAVLC